MFLHRRNVTYGAFTSQRGKLRHACRLADFVVPAILWLLFDHQFIYVNSAWPLIEISGVHA